MSCHLGYLEVVTGKAWGDHGGELLVDRDWCFVRLEGVAKRGRVWLGRK